MIKTLIVCALLVITSHDDKDIDCMCFVGYNQPPRKMHRLHVNCWLGEGLRRSLATPDPFVLTNKICLNQLLVITTPLDK